MIAEFIYSVQEKATLPWTVPAARETWTGGKFFLFYIYIRFTLRVRKRNDEDKVKGMDLEDL